MPGGLALHEFGHLGPVLRIDHVLLRLELGLEPGLDEVGAALHEVFAHRDRAGIRDAEGVPGGDDAPRALADDVPDARHRGLPQHRAVDLALAQVGGDHLDGLIQDRGGLDLGALDHQAEEAMRAAPLRRGDGLAVEPLDRLLRRFESRRVGTHHDHVAALAGREAGVRHQVDRRHASFGRGDHRRHVAEVADLLLVGEHVVDDDRALQRVLELDLAARRQVLLPQLQRADHHRRVGDRVVRLVADHQLDRLGAGGAACHQHHPKQDFSHFAPDVAR